MINPEYAVSLLLGGFKLAGVLFILAIVVVMILEAVFPKTMKKWQGSFH